MIIIKEDNSFLKRFWSLHELLADSSLGSAQFQSSEINQRKQTSKGIIANFPKSVCLHSCSKGTCHSDRSKPVFGDLSTSYMLP